MLSKRVAQAVAAGLLVTIAVEAGATRRAVAGISVRLDRGLDRLERMIMASIEDVEAAVARSGAAVAQAVSGLGDLRSKIATLTEAIASGELPQAAQERLAGIVASIDAETDSLAQALAPVVADPEVPTETPVDGAPVEEPPAQNPDTADPADVEGSVPAGEPLPDAPDGAAF